MTDERFLVRAAAKHAARLVTLHFDDGEDEAALADRFETAGLDNLARGGIDVRTDLSGFEAK